MEKMKAHGGEEGESFSVRLHETRNWANSRKVWPDKKSPVAEKKRGVFLKFMGPRYNSLKVTLFHSGQPTVPNSRYARFIRY